MFYLCLVVVFVAAASCETIEQLTDYLLFEASMAEFEAAKNVPKYHNLTFDSDGCTKVADRPLGFDFKPSCNRHDFGWRNYKNQHRDSEKQKVNDQFARDMLNVCNGVSKDKKPRKQSLEELRKKENLDAMIEYAEEDPTYNTATDSYCDYNLDTGDCDPYSISTSEDPTADLYPDLYPDTTNSESEYPTTETGGSTSPNIGSSAATSPDPNDPNYNYGTNSVCEIIAGAYKMGVDTFNDLKSEASGITTEDIAIVYGSSVGVLVFLFWR
ncbi:prokaryotic phospholipase A2-domain-containing protein [Geopyxis carbonaria]|nr:prokaryotic phospholipase A2-domain-containing protein [Geopyxis carbonaria]